MKSTVCVQSVVWLSLACVSVSYAFEDIDEEVIVVGSRIPTSSQALGGLTTVLNRTEIEALGSAHVAELLRHVPGVSVVRSGGYGGLTQVRLRGAEANHVVVLIDGIDVSTSSSGEVDFSGILSTDIERIEVVRGPKSGLYGSNAVGGVVHLFTRQERRDLRLDVSLEAGGFERRGAGLALGGGNERVDGRLTYSRFASEFDLSKDDTQGADDDAEKADTVSGYLQFKATDRLSFRLIGRRTERETDTDGFDFNGGPVQGLATDDASESDTEVRSIGFSAIWDVSDNSTYMLQWQRTESVLDGVFFGDEGSREKLIVDLHLVLDDRQTLALFAEWEQETFENLYPYDPSQAHEQNRRLYGYGLEYRTLIGETSIGVNARVDEADDFDNTMTYAVDGSHRLGKQMRLHGSYGTAVTNPTFFEQFGFVPAIFVGNAGLEPEKARGWDAGIEITSEDGLIMADLTWFESILEDEIVPRFPTVVNARGQSDRRGLEMSLTYRGQFAEVSASYTYIESLDMRGEDEVGRPRNTGSLSIQRSWRDDRVTGAFNVLYSSGHYDTDFRNYFVNGFASELTKLGSSTVVNAQVSYRLNNLVELYLRGENIFDADYEEVLSYRTPGAVALIGMRLSL